MLSLVNCNFELWQTLNKLEPFFMYWLLLLIFRSIQDCSKSPQGICNYMFYKVDFSPLIITLSQVWEKFNLKRFIGNLFQSWWNLPCKTCWICINNDFLIWHQVAAKFLGMSKSGFPQSLKLWPVFINSWYL